MALSAHRPPSSRGAAAPPELQHFRGDSTPSSRLELDARPRYSVLRLHSLRFADCEGDTLSCCGTRSPWSPTSRHARLREISRPAPSALGSRLTSPSGERRYEHEVLIPCPARRMASAVCQPVTSRSFTSTVPDRLNSRLGFASRRFPPPFSRRCLIAPATHPEMPHDCPVRDRTTC